MSAPRLFKTSEFKIDKDKKYSDELKDIPIVAKYDGWVSKHNWSNSTELLLDLYNEAKVWNMETNSQTKVDKKPKEEKEFLNSSSTYIKQKIQISPNEFLIVSVTYKYFNPQKPNKYVNSEQWVAITRKHRAARKPEINWQDKEFASWGVYKKNNNGVKS